jgi:septal ring factor EnvC (AmiA/AmiB activator)
MNANELNTIDGLAEAEAECFAAELELHLVEEAVKDTRAEVAYLEARLAALEAKLAGEETELREARRHLASCEAVAERLEGGR